MVRNLIDSLLGYNSTMDFMDEITKLYKNMLKGTHTIDEHTKVDFREMENGIKATYVITGKGFDINDKCEEILSAWEVPAKLLKDDTEIRISFPDEDMGFIYKWDTNNNCFAETVTCGDFSQPALESDVKEDKDDRDSKIEVKEESSPVVPPHNEIICDPDFFPHVNVDRSKLPQCGDYIDPKSYTLVSRYGNIGIIIMDGLWNFIDTDDNTIFSDDWYDYISDFRNNYCIVGKYIDGKRKYAIFDVFVDQISDWYDYIDEMLFTDGWCMVKNGDKFNFITEDDEEMCECGFDAACKFYHGFALISGLDSVPESKGKWNFVDVCGNVLSDVWFDHANAFEAFYAEVIIDGKYAHINMNGEIFYSNPDDKKEVCECERTCSGCECAERDNSVDDSNLAKKVKADIKAEKKEIITDEADERLMFMPKSALSIFRDIINDKTFDVINDNGEDVGIEFYISQLIAEPENDMTYDDVVNHIITEEALMLDRFCKYVKTKFGFSRAIWEGIDVNNKKDILFKIYF